jgi:hypothetical protein
MMRQPAQPFDFGELGLSCLQRRDIPQALSYFERDLRAGADPMRHLSERWSSWMLLGHFEKAWQESDRLAPPMRLEEIRSARIAIRCLRGLGDAIQFLRFAPALRARCAHLTVQAPPRLLPLLRHAASIDVLVSTEANLESSFDFQVECSDLPYLFRASLSTLPPPGAYLNLPLDTGNGHPNRHLRVGLVWAAGEWNPTRSVPLATFAPLAELAGVRLFSLQRGSGELQTSQVKWQHRIPSLEQESGTILDTVSTLRSLDLIISVDTMIAHLAGALNRPVWTMLQFAADWRWMLNRSDSPWYPSMRLFRQPSPGDWASVVRSVTARLPCLQGTD